MLLKLKYYVNHFMEIEFIIYVIVWFNSNIGKPDLDL